MAYSRDAAWGHYNGDCTVGEEKITIENVYGLME
jgi:hypothetical protein